MRISRQRQVIREAIRAQIPVERIAWMLGITENQAIELIKKEKIELLKDKLL